jgi:hypothetical protein
MLSYISSVPQNSRTVGHPGDNFFLNVRNIYG